jgi:tellurite resistance-related uncharacterized protein
VAFKKFFEDHKSKIKDWATLKAHWGDQCWIDADKDSQMTIKDEVLFLIGAPTEPAFDPDKVPQDATTDPARIA